jgi:hypothetical protein
MASPVSLYEKAARSCGTAPRIGWSREGHARNVTISATRSNRLNQKSTSFLHSGKIGIVAQLGAHECSPVGAQPYCNALLPRGGGSTRTKDYAESSNFDPRAYFSVTTNT